MTKNWELVRIGLAALPDDDARQALAWEALNALETEFDALRQALSDAAALAELRAQEHGDGAKEADAADNKNVYFEQMGARDALVRLAGDLRSKKP